MKEELKKNTKIFKVGPDIFTFFEDKFNKTKQNSHQFFSQNSSTISTSEKIHQRTRNYQDQEKSKFSKIINLQKPSFEKDSEKVIQMICKIYPMMSPNLKN